MPRPFHALRLNNTHPKQLDKRWLIGIMLLNNNMPQTETTAKCYLNNLETTKQRKLDRRGKPRSAVGIGKLRHIEWVRPKWMRQLAAFDSIFTDQGTPSSIPHPHPYYRTEPYPYRIRIFVSVKISEFLNCKLQPPLIFEFLLLVYF